MQSLFTDSCLFDGMSASPKNGRLDGLFILHTIELMRNLVFTLLLFLASSCLIFVSELSDLVQILCILQT